MGRGTALARQAARADSAEANKRTVFSMEFSHYDEVPRNVAEAIIAKSKGNA
jgi:translation elongation factor EF-G